MNIMDTRVIPIRKETRRNTIGRTFQRRSVNVKKLMKPDINRKYQGEISYKLAQLPNKLNSAEKEWIDFKEEQKRRWNKKIWRAAEKGHSMVERGDKTSYEIEKTIIQEVAERSNTTEQRTLSVSQRCMQTSYQTGQIKGMVRVW